MSKTDFLQNLVVFKGLITNWAIVSGGGVASVGASLPITSTGGGNPVIGWSTDQADILNRSLFDAQANQILNWSDYINVFKNMAPDVGPGYNYQLASFGLQAVPVSSTNDKYFTALGANVAIDPFNAGFDIQQAVPLDTSLNHRNAQGKLGYSAVGRFFANLGDPVLTGGKLDQLEILAGNAFIDQGYSIGNYYGLTLNANFSAGSAMHGINPNVTQISSNPVYRQTGVSNIHGIDMYAQLYSAVAQGVNIFSGSYNQFGSSAYWVEAQLGSQFRSGSTTPDYKGVNISPSFDVGSTNGNLVLLNIGPNGPVAADSVAGIMLNLDNAASSTGFGSNGRTMAIQASGGFLNSFYSTKSQSGIFFDAVNQSIVQANIESGTPVTGTEFISHSIISLAAALDDYTSGPLGLGICNLLSGGQVSVAAGKTVQSLANTVSGRSVPAQPGDGGTVTNSFDFRAFGTFNIGGSLNIVNYKAFALDAAANAAYPATNAWGIHIADPSVDNWFSRSIVIGATTEKTTHVGYAIEVGDKKAFKWTPMTVAERDALFPTPAEGTEVAISDGVIKEKQYFDGTNWLGM